MLMLGSGEGCAGMDGGGSGPGREGTGGGRGVQKEGIETLQHAEQSQPLTASSSHDSRTAISIQVVPAHSLPHAPGDEGVGDGGGSGGGEGAGAT